MQEDKLYDTLLNLPLFLGMSRADLLQIAGHTKFDFQKIEGGETLTEIGEPYHRLLFLLSGEVAVETMADDRGYRIVETIKAPEVFMIERLFGYDQHSPHHYVARNDCSLMSISKKEVLRLAKQYEIFHINLLNLISTQAQRQSPPLQSTPEDAQRQHHPILRESLPTPGRRKKHPYQDGSPGTGAECQAAQGISGAQRTGDPGTDRTPSRQNQHPCTREINQ